MSLWTQDQIELAEELADRIGGDPEQILQDYSEEEIREMLQ